MEKNDKIVCTNIWKVFGPNEKNVLTNLDKNLSRSEVQEKTGHVVAVKDVSYGISALWSFPSSKSDRKYWLWT